MKKILYSLFVSLIFTNISFSLGEVCYSDGFCVPIRDVVEEPTVYLVGNHHDDEGTSIEATFRQLSCDKQVMYAFESVARDSVIEKEVIEKLVRMGRLNCASTGYFYGIEGEVAILFMDVVYPMLYSHGQKADHDREFVTQTQELLLNLYLKQPNQKLWRLFSSFLRKQKDPLLQNAGYKRIDEFFHFAKDYERIDRRFSQRLFSTHAKISRQDWNEVLLSLAFFMYDEYISKLPLEDQPHFERFAKEGETSADTFKRLFKKMHSPAAQYANRFYLNIDWRTYFWKKHFFELYRQAKEVKKDLVFIVGQDQYQEFKKFLDAQGVKLVTRSVPLNLSRAEVDDAFDHLSDEDIYGTPQKSERYLRVKNQEKSPNISSIDVGDYTTTSNGII